MLAEYESFARAILAIYDLQTREQPYKSVKLQDGV